MSALRPVPPPALTALREHMAGCEACQAQKGCAAGEILARAWLHYEERMRDRLRPSSPH